MCHLCEGSEVADEKILLGIEGLVDEERRLREGEATENAERLVDVEKTLDQCWDLLRRRRALREFGLDPDEASVRIQARSRGICSNCRISKRFSESGDCDAHLDVTRRKFRIGSP